MKELARELAAIEEDLQKKKPSREVLYTYPYNAIGVVSLLSQRLTRYAGRLDELVEVFKQKIPDRSRGPRFVHRVEGTLGDELKDINELIEYWLNELPDSKPLDEETLVDAETEIGIRIDSRMTELHCIWEGARVVGDEALYPHVWPGVMGLSKPLQELLEKFARLKFDEARLEAVRRNHPPSSVLWWEYWEEELEIGS